MIKHLYTSYRHFSLPPPQLLFSIMLLVVPALLKTEVPHAFCWTVFHHVHQLKRHHFDRKNNLCFTPPRCNNSDWTSLHHQGVGMGVGEQDEIHEATVFKLWRTSLHLHFQEMINKQEPTKAMTCSLKIYNCKKGSMITSRIWWNC